jgi:hypothetical protein
MSQIKAPFTPPIVVELNRYQHGFWHPFTCGNNRHDTAHTEYANKHGGDFGALVATRNGWVCPVCGYRQDWAHSGMVEMLVPYTTIGPFDPEPMDINPVTHERKPTKNGIRPIQTYYCIYDHPADFPENFVVRQWHRYEGIADPIESEHRLAVSLDSARALVPGNSMFIDRFAEDDPYIVEVWVQREAETI